MGVIRGKKEVQMSFNDCCKSDIDMQPNAFGIAHSVWCEVLGHPSKKEIRSKSVDFHCFVVLVTLEMDTFFIIPAAKVLNEHFTIEIHTSLCPIRFNISLKLSHALWDVLGSTGKYWNLNEIWVLIKYWNSF